MHDNPALFHSREVDDVVAVYFLVPAQTPPDLSPTRSALTVRALADLRKNLHKIGIPLRVHEITSHRDLPDAIARVASMVRATTVAYNADYTQTELLGIDDASIALDRSGFKTVGYAGTPVISPGDVVKKDGTPYKVFTAFRRKWLEQVDIASLEPLPPPRGQANVIEPVNEIEAFESTDACFRQDLWPANELDAIGQLRRFVDTRGKYYATKRDHPALDSTSRLSPYLSVGMLSARQCFHAALVANGGLLHGGQTGLDAWINELIWREFYQHAVTLNPSLREGCAFKRATDDLPWETDAGVLLRWQSGETGFPFVDAGMRQLNQTGWMHNRVRMVVAQFLTKHLFVDWRLGEAYFMASLVDCDFAANNGGWQWSASTGTDAAPYFRMVNPTRQGQRYDAQGKFVRRFIPELTDVPDKLLFEPWKSDKARCYPTPIVDLDTARRGALMKWKRLNQH